MTEEQKVLREHAEQIARFSTLYDLYYHGTQAQSRLASWEMNEMQDGLWLRAEDYTHNSYLAEFGEEP
jgi:hypothetical protein